MSPEPPRSGGDRTRARAVRRHARVRRPADSPGLTILPGLDWPGESHEESLARAAEELGRRVRQAAERGVRLSVEPHVGSICRSPDDALRLCELTPGLELTLDYSHYVLQGFDDAEIEPLLAHARHFHARGSAEGRMAAPLSESTIDWERAIDAMREHGYDGWVGLEYVWSAIEPGMNEVDVLSESILLRERLQAKLAEPAPEAHRPGVLRRTTA